MRALIGALLLLVCAGLTAHRLPAWRSDDALWLDAHRRSLTLPRPMLNIGAAAFQRGEPVIAERWWSMAEQTGRLSAGEEQALRRMRCHVAILYGDPSVPLVGCS